ncbi:MAG: FKBP-type peptidyl-prolyl cis-trans isomerase [Planctomycetaceae bacterium]|nr:FKBP-type peptidyl-prolyl cis-trans isomerase [Planctomycetaceae bacterium]
MRFVVSAMSAAVLLVGQALADEKIEFKTLEEKISYGIGLNIGRQVGGEIEGLDLDKFFAGVTAGVKGKDPQLTAEQLQAAFTEFQKKMAEKAARASEENLEAARKFLVENKKKAGVKTTKSGLQYMVIKEGTGAKPTTDSTVSTHYRGKLLSGKVFDESYKGDAPAEGERAVSFGVTQVIPGWTEALQLMKVGAKYRLFIRPDLAYGERAPGSIPPNSLLIFDIELISVK